MENMLNPIAYKGLLSNSAAPGMCTHVFDLLPIVFSAIQKRAIWSVSSETDFVECHGEDSGITYV